MNADQHGHEADRTISFDPEFLDEEGLRLSLALDEIREKTGKKKEEWHSFETI